MNVLQHTRNELNLCLKENRPDRSYRDTLLIYVCKAKISKKKKKKNYLGDKNETKHRLFQETIKDIRQERTIVPGYLK